MSHFSQESEPNCGQSCVNTIAAVRTLESAKEELQNKGQDVQQQQQQYVLCSFDHSCHSCSHLRSFLFENGFHGSSRRLDVFERLPRCRGTRVIVQVRRLVSLRGGQFASSIASDRSRRRREGRPRRRSVRASSATTAAVGELSQPAPPVASVDALVAQRRRGRRLTVLVAPLVPYPASRPLLPRYTSPYRGRRGLLLPRCATAAAVQGLIEATTSPAVVRDAGDTGGRRGLAISIRRAAALRVFSVRAG